MADQLYLSLWYPNFRLEALPAALIGLLRQFARIAKADQAAARQDQPASGENSAPAPLGRVLAASAYPIDWTESPTFQRIYVNDERAQPSADTEGSIIENAVAEATAQLHEDMAFELEMCWMLWMPSGGLNATWRLEPVRVKFTGFGPEFDAASYDQNGHIRVDFGLDTAWTLEDQSLGQDAAERIRQNVEKLLAFTLSVEKHCGISSRLLWTESGEPLAEKLVARLQRLN